MNNQLNPDPQGGESNMTDEQVVRQVYPAVATEVEYLGHDYDNGNAGWSATLTVQVGFADGAHENTAISNAWADARAKLPEGAITQPTPTDCACGGAMTHATIHTEEFCEQEPAAQPVPSAGSRPQEEGGMVIDWKRIEDLAKEELCVDGDASHVCNVCIAILAAREMLRIKSQPVADGGGTEYQRGFNDCRDECMQIVDEHDGYLTRISLLSPEGSSR